MNQNSWKRDYVLRSSPHEIQDRLSTTQFATGGRTWELLCFLESPEARNVLLSPGSAGHAYVFAELAYLIHRHGHNVFVMPRQGSTPLAELVERHIAAARHIAKDHAGAIGLYGEGLGGYAAFYVALAHGPVQSLVCENSPGILTERDFHVAILAGGGAARRRRWLLPALKLLSLVAPWLPVPIPLYLDFAEMIDSEEPAHSIEARIIQAYRHDPDFDKWYSLDAVLSLLSTPPPRPLAQLEIPTMFLLAKRGITPEYLRSLYARLPVTKKRLLEVEGSVFWMVSHPVEAALALHTWFDETLPRQRSPVPSR
jgi:hypothetical protein